MLHSKFFIFIITNCVLEIFSKKINAKDFIFECVKKSFVNTTAEFLKKL